MVGRFVGDGLASGEAALLAVPPETLALLQGELYAGDAFHRRRAPGRYHRGRAEPEPFHGDGGRVHRRVPGPAGPDRQPARVAGPHRRRSSSPASNTRHWSTRVWTAYPATSLCLYDASVLDDEVLADARATHPLLWKYGVLQRSPDYAPTDVLGVATDRWPRIPGPSHTWSAVGGPSARAVFRRRLRGLDGAVRRRALRIYNWSRPSWPPTACCTRGAPAGWPSGKTTGIWCARHETPDSSTIRWWAASTRAPAAPRVAACTWSTPFRDLVRTHTTTTGTTIQAYVRFELAVGQAG